MDVKIVMSKKDGKSYQATVGAETLLGKKIGEKVDGGKFGFPGYEFEVTGGSDKEGFPMRKDLPGTKRRKLFLSGGTGFLSRRKGMRKKKSVRGNKIGEDIVQVNLKVLKAGKKPLKQDKGDKADEQGEAK
jgi:small subunit ribosomal protein S6e